MIVYDVKIVARDGQEKRRKKILWIFLNIFKGIDTSVINFNILKLVKVLYNFFILCFIQNSWEWENILHKVHMSKDSQRKFF